MSWLEDNFDNNLAEDYANKKENSKNITIEKWDENLFLKSLKFQFNSIYGYIVKYTTTDLKYSVSAKINNRSEMIFEMTANDIWQEVEDEYFSITYVGI